MSTDKASDDVLIPSQQELVPFYGRELLAVRLADGRIAAVLRWICEGLGIDTNAQTQRIRRKRALVRDLVTVRVQTPGGPQDMAALALHGLPGWLYTIDETRVNEEARDGVILFQYEATDVLYRHFADRPQELAAPLDLVSETQIERPEKPIKEATAELWADYYERMAEWLRWQADIGAWRQGVEQWRGSVEARLEGVEELARIVPELLNRMGPETISPERQASIREAVKQLHELAGLAFSTIYADLNASFHVARYQDIQETDWPRVADWLKVRIEAAQKRRRG